MLILVPIFISSFVGAFTIQHVSLPRDLVGRSIKDNYTPHPPPFKWYALGDSYTAGPGAGGLDPSNKGKCARSQGAYEPQLHSDWLYDTSNEAHFLACTGDKTPKFIKEQLPAIDSEPPPDLAILTIGGNDIGFSKIAKTCLVGLTKHPDCITLMANARDTFNSDDFKNKIETIYDGILDQMKPDFRYQILHLGYPAFFNADDDSTWCNDQTLGKFLVGTFNPPKLSLQLRRWMNELSFDFNTKLANIVGGYVQRKMSEPDRATAIKNGWYKSRVYFGDIDGGINSVFNGHRFCEKGDSDPRFGQPTTWLFGVWGPQKDTGPDGGNTAASGSSEVGAEAFTHVDASSCLQDPQYDDDDAFAWDCDMAGYYANSTTDHSVTTVTGSDFTRSFHPKTRGFTAVKDFLHYAIHQMRQAPEVNTCLPNGNIVIYNDTGANPTSGGQNSVVSVPTPSALPASLCATAVSAFDTALPSTTQAAPSSSATCTFTGDPVSGGCQCSDGTTPPRDEDERCCLYHQPEPTPVRCWNHDGTEDS